MLLHESIHFYASFYNYGSDIPHYCQAHIIQLYSPDGAHIYY